MIGCGVSGFGCGGRLASAAMLIAIVGAVYCGSYAPFVRLTLVVDPNASANGYFLFRPLDYLFDNTRLRYALLERAECWGVEDAFVCGRMKRAIQRRIDPDRGPVAIRYQGVVNRADAEVSVSDLCRLQ